MDPIAGVLRVLRLIVAAMALGVLSFAVISLGLVQVQGALSPGTGLARLLMPVLGALVLAQLIGFAVLRRFLVAGLKKRLDAARAAAPQPARGETPVPRPGLDALLRTYHLVTIVGSGFAESAALFGLVIYLLTGATVALFAPLLALFVFVLLFPNRARLAALAAEVDHRELCEAP